MERPVPLTPMLSVTPQLGEADVVRAAALGFKAVINNRPDGESDGQPTGAALAAAAQRAGLGYRHIPVVPGNIADADVDAFAAALRALEGPVLAFCRTGTRSATLWALCEADHRDPDAILRTCAAAGYRLDALRPRLAARRAAAQQR